MRYSLPATAVPFILITHIITHFEKEIDMMILRLCWEVIPGKVI